MRRFTPCMLLLVLLLPACGTVDQPTAPGAALGAYPTPAAPPASAPTAPLPTPGVATASAASNDPPAMPPIAACVFPAATAEDTPSESITFSEPRLVHQGQYLSNNLELNMTGWLTDNQTLLLYAYAPFDKPSIRYRLDTTTQRLTEIEQVSGRLTPLNARVGPAFLTTERGPVQYQIKTQPQDSRPSATIAETGWLPLLSPTGAWLITVPDDTTSGAIYRRNADAGYTQDAQATALYHQLPGSFRPSVVWSADETQLIMQAHDQLYRLDLRTMTLCQVAHPALDGTDEWIVYRMDWSPDQQQLLLHVAIPVPDSQPRLVLAVLDLQTSTIRSLDAVLASPYEMELHWLTSNSAIVVLADSINGYAASKLWLINTESNEIHAVFDNYYFIPQLYNDGLIISPDRQHIGVAGYDVSTETIYIYIIDVIMKGK